MEFFRYDLVSDLQTRDDYVTACLRHHWSLSSPMTTQHLLSVIACANTLMSMTHATFATQTKRVRSPRV